MTGPKGSPTPPSNPHSQKKQQQQQQQFRITKRKNEERKILTL